MCLPMAMTRPNDVLSQGEHAGLEWLTMHNGLGFRCGYVRLPAGHPWYGMNYDDIPADVHGGLTYAGYDEPCDKPGNDDAYWIGFDCAHSGDGQDPALMAPDAYVFPSYHGQTIRDQAYVERQCELLCKQADKIDVVEWRREDQRRKEVPMATTT